MAEVSISMLHINLFFLLFFTLLLPCSILMDKYVCHPPKFCLTVGEYSKKNINICYLYSVRGGKGRFAASQLHACFIFLVLFLGLLFGIYSFVFKCHYLSVAEVNKDIAKVKPGSYWAEWPSQLVLLSVCLKNHGNMFPSVRRHSETI